MGPSLAVNSACSGALSAVAQACSSLLAHQADMALAGGSALTFPNHGFLFEAGFLNSIDGTVRPFDARACGTVFGDGVAAVVLRRLTDAIAADDHVLSIIRGCGITSDGSRKAGYAAPGIAGQVAAVIAAHESAGVSSSEVSYVECHATGTLVGDGIELRALTQAFSASTPAVSAARCAIGSIKGNIGHANAAAGVTGLIKASLCLSHRTLVPRRLSNRNKPAPRLLSLEVTPSGTHCSFQGAQRKNSARWRTFLRSSGHIPLGGASWRRAAHRRRLLVRHRRRQRARRAAGAAAAHG